MTREEQKARARERLARWREGKTMTNADRVRLMSDIELAEFMNGCPPGYVRGRDCKSLNSCSLCWIEWLRAEVKQ